MSTPPWSIICAMSREDSQFKLRMPAELREKIEEAAKDSKRSLNAEIVARLEDSEFRSGTPTQIPSASKARQLAASARKRTAEQVRNEVLLELQSAISKGASVARADLRDLDLELLSETEHDDVTSELCRELESAGYKLEWDGPDFLSIDFEDRT